jgi:hypothetical protein
MKVLLLTEKKFNIWTRQHQIIPTSTILQILGNPHDLFALQMTPFLFLLNCCLARYLWLMAQHFTILNSVSNTVGRVLSVFTKWCLAIKLFVQKTARDYTVIILNKKYLFAGHKSQATIRIYWSYDGLYRTRGGAVGWDTALQAGRSRVWIPMASLEFFIEIILPATLWPWCRPNL